ncbi:MAG TPA: hypothetical protein VHV82_09105 [Sporichthyaceae bacterium]|nr:hypothetical protein [Sporichthyaceae bacterium]
MITVLPEEYDGSPDPPPEDVDPLGPATWVEEPEFAGAGAEAEEDADDRPVAGAGAAAAGPPAPRVAGP